MPRTAHHTGARIMGILKPHIFFDDQQGHLESTSRATPSVHVPFGRLDEPAAPVPADPGP